MASVEATCSCGASFKTSGPDILHCEWELARFLNAHEKCRKNNNAIHTDSESRAVLEGVDYIVNQVDAETISLTRRR